MITLTAGPDDFLRCRFAVSPLWETLTAVRVLLNPTDQFGQLRWLGDVPPLAELSLGLLPLLLPAHGYSPDFLSPPPAEPFSRIEDELERVRTTPTDQVIAELRRALSVDGRGDAEVTRLLAAPALTPDHLVEVIHRVWQQLLEPHWQAVRDVLDADLLYRSRQVSRGGLEALLADLNPTVHITSHTIAVDGPLVDHRNLDGRGLLFMPTVFGWPGVSIFTDLPSQPALIYPARGIGDGWQRPDPSAAHLIPLLGKGRVGVLSSLASPTSTTRLARQLGLSPATVSHHLKILSQAGLTSGHRAGYEVLYIRTELGDRVLGRRDEANS